MDAYCMKCKAKRQVQNPKQITMKNGKPATQGTCPVCGTKVFRIGKEDCANPPQSPSSIHIYYLFRDGQCRPIPFIASAEAQQIHGGNKVCDDVCWCQV